MMTLTGLFHLIVRSPLVTPEKLPQFIAFTIDKNIQLPDLPDSYSDLRLMSRNGELIWRLTVPGGIAYVDARTGRDLKLWEEEWARGFAEASKGAGQLIPMFTSEYGFAYKRLPVWRFEKDKEIVFVDPAEGLIAAKVSPIEVTETAAFTTLHKWQFLDTLTGKPGRDIVIVVVVLLIAAMAITGLVLRLKRKP